MPTYDGCETDFYLGTWCYEGACTGWSQVPYEPEAFFEEAVDTRVCGDGTIVEVGFPKATWKYPAEKYFFGDAMAWFKGFCGDVASAKVCVRTRTNEVDALGRAVFRCYEAVMHRIKGQPHTKRVRCGGTVLVQTFTDVEFVFSYMVEVDCPAWV